MKRKLCAFLLMLAVAVFSVCSLSACDDDEKENFGLQMGVKYIYRSCVNSDDTIKENYYVFHSDGTGEYVQKYMGSYSRLNHYTIGFKYTFVDNEKSTVVCFYDFIKYEEDHIADKNSQTHWVMTIGVSKNVLIALDSASSMYISEKYIQSIPNYTP